MPALSTGTTSRRLPADERILSHAPLGGLAPGNAVVQRRVGDRLEDVPYDVPFAFAFAAFRPDGVIHHVE